MANQIILKRSSTPSKVPTTAQLALGEIAINTHDGLIYIKKDDGTPSVVQIGGVTSVNSKSGAVVLSTSDVAEGSAQYFTNARARSAVSVSGNLSYNSGTGVISYSTPTTIASLSNHSTDSLVEGNTNKYYADSLARGAISVAAGVGGYNASTGVISIPNNTSQLTNGANFATQSYVASAVGAISTSTISQGNSNIAVVDNGTGTVTVTVDGSTALTVDATGVVVAGNFTVSGTTTTVNSNTIALADNILTLNSDATGTPTQNAGLEVNRGTSANVQLRWNEGSQTWTFTNDGSVYYPMAVSTTDLAEGTNQYFTTTRARTSISATSASGISYNNASGVFSLSSIPNSSLVNNSISINGTSVALGGSRTLGTDDVAEGLSNQYFTTARARGAVSASGSLAYNSSTGVFSYTTPTTIASLSNHTTTGLAEGTNLYYTDARAVSANTSAIATAKSEAINTAATDATTKVAAEATARATAVTAAIATAASDATSKVAAEATARDAAIAAAVALKDNTDEITEGTTNLYFTNARARGAVSAGTGISYNSTTGAISSSITQYTDALAVSANTTAIATAKSEAISTAATDATTKANAAKPVAGTGISVSGTTVSSTITQYTDALARAAHSAGTGISYNSTTGAISADTTVMSTKSYVDTSISNLVNGASAAYDTLLEIQNAMATDAELASAIAAITTVTNATKLATARTINGVSFDGTANVTVTTAGTGISVSGTTVTNTLSTSGGTIGGSLAVTGGITATGEITAYFSDERLKKDISPIQGALDKVMAIGGYTYKANDLAHELGVSRYDNQIGLLAQEVEAVMPELVTQSGLPGYKTIRYDKVVSVLVEAIKEQQAMIEELRKDVKKTLR